MPKKLPILLVVLVMISGCSQSRTTAVVETPPAYQPPPSDAKINLPTIGSAKLPEVQDAVRRVFKDSAVIDSNSKPSFFTGDFNGDASQDLAVVVRPVTGKLAEMNEEYPSWLLRDPSVDTEVKKPVLNVSDQEALLAIIHGFGDNNWRDPQATQTFLLKNAVGANMSVITGKEFSAAHSGKKLPQASGDLIAENLRGTDGYLYYSSANYLWYDPKNYKPKPPSPGMFHSR